jgi:hypothetical protein
MYILRFDRQYLLLLLIVYKKIRVNENTFNIEYVMTIFGRSRWPRGLRCGSADAWMLGSRVRIPLMGMDVYKLCCNM